MAPLPTDNTPYTGELVVVATSTDPDGSLSIEVTDVVDEGEECEEEDDAAPEPADVPDLPCLDICGPSDFYRGRDQLEQWFQDAFGS